MANNMKRELNLLRFLRFQKEVGEIYDRMIARTAAECGISKPEADVLMFLANHPVFDAARDVAIYRGVSKAYVSKAVERLLAGGLLSSETGHMDRRFQHLHVNDTAWPCVEKLRVTQRKFMSLLLNDVTPSE
ncbi:MAG: helix-turn-helix domain-containing protein, partial [Oscillospiraceae bacterium]